MENNKQIKPWPLEAKTGLALTLTASVVIGGVLLFGKNNRRDTPIENSNNVAVESNNPIEVVPSHDDPVVETIETLIKPYKVNASVSRFFYDANDDVEKRANSIVTIPSKEATFMKNLGVDYSYNGQEFDVVASCSGKVVERINDATYGNMLVIEHDSGLKTIYSSLSSFNVTKGNSVNQGDVIARAGKSLYTSEVGVSLHFELIKNGVYLNPEKAFTLEVNKI